jgi:Protein of unknown function (DUF3096)
VDKKLRSSGFNSRPATAEWGATFMSINSTLILPILALLAGILILLRPRLLNHIVAIYLIVVGIIGLWPHLVR